ncbi:hypothetical protein N5J48_00845 [Acinetobacter ursingii]|uniref:Secreted protein n=1 Tax=Acinetobacter ursingii TaxID=108980 RepID=A0AA46NTU0_9GAMM|nr:MULTISPECIES: hypothetical protein [Acinetobacter]MCH2006085.1 hypothetical protein [Acinetobacter ursingii]MDG9858715.1 hypothetical protein [Acinetobacter ursingii]MDG9892592.1 hypothetical protein [Acinetobacter ursingii]MDG9991359.1 hypothetical protein [Acinetobacter ursingii]MDH0005723.1 hypothetical protein [Acinetobacter ursingii]
MKKFRSILLVILSLLGCMLSVPIQAQISLPSANLSPIYHIQHWSLQPQQQNDDDDVRERREEEIVRDIRAVRLDRPQ